MKEKILLLALLSVNNASWAPIEGEFDDATADTVSPIYNVIEKEEFDLANQPSSGQDDSGNFIKTKKSKRH